MPLDQRSAWMRALTMVEAMASNLVHAKDADEKAVVEAANEFHVALDAMFTGDLTPMREVWSHAADVTDLGPGGGFQVGWTQVMSAW